MFLPPITPASIGPVARKLAETLTHQRCNSFKSLTATISAYTLYNL
jgi:hypothetical protein